MRSINSPLNIIPILYGHIMIGFHTVFLNYYYLDQTLFYWVYLAEKKMQKRMYSIKLHTNPREPYSQTCGSDLWYVTYASRSGFLHTSNLLCEKIWGENPTLLSGKCSIFFLSVELGLASETKRQFFST